MDIKHMITHLFLFLCLLSICVYSFLLILDVPYIGRMFKTKQVGYLGIVRCQKIKIWQKIFLAFSAIGGYICAYKGTQFMLGWLPLSWGGHDEYGEFIPARETLTLLISFLLIVGIVMVYVDAADLREKRRTFSNSSWIDQFIYYNFRIFLEAPADNLLTVRYARELEEMTHGDLLYFAHDDCLRNIDGELDIHQIQTLRQGYEMLIRMVQLRETLSTLTASSDPE